MGQTKKLTAYNCCTYFVVKYRIFTKLGAIFLAIFLGSQFTYAAPKKKKTPSKTAKKAPTNSPPAPTTKNPVPLPATNTPPANATPTADATDPNAIVENPAATYLYFLPDGNIQFSHRLSYEGEFGMGVPGNQSLTGTSMHFGLAAHYYLKSDLDVSTFVRRTNAKGVDDVLFDTGYEEVRNYTIGVNMIGVGARLRAYKNLTLEARTGISLTSSSLSAITTTAPQAPTLSVGYNKSIPMGFPLDLQVAYEFRKPRMGISVIAGYTMSAFGKNESLAEISLGVGIKFYGIEWEKREEKPVSNTSLAGPAPEGAAGGLTLPGEPGAKPAIPDAKPGANVSNPTPATPSAIPPANPPAAVPPASTPTSP